MEDLSFLNIGFVVFLIILMLWSVVWKGIALWRAGNNKHLSWFVVMFLINTAGILEILYIFLWGKKESGPKIPEKIQQM